MIQVLFSAVTARDLLRFSGMAKIRVAGHALHPMLIVFPLGLLGTSLAWDLVYLATRDPMWAQIAFWTIVAGVIGAVLAAAPGFIDWMAIPDHTRAKRIGIYHLVLNVLVLFLFIISAAARYTHGYTSPTLGMMVIGWIGVLLAIVSGWFGGELVERLGIGVYPDANANAPSSLKTSARDYDRPYKRPTEPTPA
jgi:uncharacterized membrane protein